MEHWTIRTTVRFPLVITVTSKRDTSNSSGKGKMLMNSSMEQLKVITVNQASMIKLWDRWQGKAVNNTLAHQVHETWNILVWSLLHLWSTTRLVSTRLLRSSMNHSHQREKYNQFAVMTKSSMRDKRKDLWVHNHRDQKSMLCQSHQKCSNHQRVPKCMKLLIGASSLHKWILSRKLSK
jgi:hypothetical protein